MSDTRAATLRALLFASSAASMLCAAPVLAAEAPGDEVGKTAPTAEELQQQQGTTQVGDVDVNGRRIRREPTSPRYVAPLLDTPRAVTVIPQEIIEQTGATSLMDVLRTSPGISFEAGEGGQPLADRPFIRGQSSGNNIFVDGIRDTGGQQREVFNLEQVEVIKGPDSVYSGRGSGGGSINLGSKSPRQTDFTTASLGVGADNYIRATIDQNWSLGDTAAVRFNLMGNQGDVAGRGPVDFQKWGAAVALAAGLGTDTTGTVSYYHLTSDSLPDYGVPLFTKRVRGTTAPYAAAPVFTRPDASGILNVPFDTFYGLTARDYLTSTVDSFTAAFMHRFSDTLTLRNTSRYSHTLNDYIVTNPADGGYVGYAPATQTYWMKRGTKTRWNPADTYANVTDLAGSFLTGGIKHSFDVGVELSMETNRNAAYSTYTTSGATCPTGLIAVSGTFPAASSALGAGDCTQVYNPNPDDPWTGVINRGPASTVRTETVGVYGFDSIALSERFIINLGLRWDSYSARGTTLNATQLNGVWTINPQDPAPVVAPATPLAPGIVLIPKNTWEFTNYQIGAVFKPTPSTSLYASFATSSTPPTISAGDQNTATAVGSGNLSTTVLDPEDTESFEIGAKANIFNNRLALSAAAFHLTRKNAAILVDVGVYAQAGEVEVQGIELGVSGSITPTWQVFGGYTYMDSELVRGAVNATTGAINVNQGDRLGNTPEHSASLFTTYRIIPKLSIGGGVYYVGDNFAGNAQGSGGGGANKIYTPAYTRVDLFASYDLSARASLQLNVQNANDEEYYARNNGTHHADPAPARSATLALNYRF
ncbi:TonB-dependent siderophore receptor [soil metagenome]